jgi:hypothetical protein
MDRWYRVNADYGNGMRLVGEVLTMKEVRALEQRARQEGARDVEVWECEDEAPGDGYPIKA